MKKSGLCCALLSHCMLSAKSPHGAMVLVFNCWKNNSVPLFFHSFYISGSCCVLKADEDCLNRHQI